MTSHYSSSKVQIGGVDLSTMVLDASNRKKNASILKAGYTPMKRRFEIAVSFEKDSNVCCASSRASDRRGQGKKTGF